MMGRNHGRTGVIAGLGIAACIPSAPLPVQLLAVVVTGGAALVPDIDHPQASAARSLGFLTRAIAKGVNRLSLALFYATREERDSKERRDGHRLITHTPLGALAYAVGVGGLSLVHPLAGGIATLLLSRLLFLVLPFGGRGKGPGGTLALLSGGTAWWLLTYESAWWWVLPLSALVGCITHIGGDCATNSGCPVWFPLVREGKRWGAVSFPVTFSAGDHIEAAIVTPLLIIAMVGAGGGWMFLSLSALAEGVA